MKLIFPHFFDIVFNGAGAGISVLQLIPSSRLRRFLKGQAGCFMNLVLFFQEHAFFRSIYRFFAAILRIIPYYWMEERLLEENAVNIKPREEPLDVEFLTEAEIRNLVSHPEVPDNIQEMNQRIDGGCVCLGIKHEGQLAAFCFCDPNYFQYKHLRKRLKDHEAYLFDMRTFHAYRGKNLAPFLRYQLYKKMAERGKMAYYSLTVLLNTSSMKFKSKLGARRIKLCVYVCIFSKFAFNVTLKKYKLD